MLKTAAVILMSLGLATAAQAGGDAAKGEKVFKKCKACHQVGGKAKNSVGPVLNGIVGRPVATAPGFKYSKAMTARGASGAIWNEADLTTFLADPKGTVPGTKMPFKGLKKESEIANVIAYLGSQN